MFLTIVNSLSRPSGVPIRRETLHGRPHIVVPMAMMEEGVWDGSDGPVLYTNEEFDKSIPTWNNKPIAVYHPKMNGQPISACHPDVLNTQTCGVILNTVRDTKLRAEAWLDEERTQALAPGVITNIENNVMTEISTGIISDPNSDKGTWSNGKPYVAKAVNIKGDHLAILPDSVGAYSIAAGAGLLRVNEASFDEIRCALRKALAAKLGKPGEYWDGYVEDVYTDKVIVWEDGQFWQFAYTVSNSVVTLGAGPTKVVRVTEYRTAGGGVVANARAVLTSNEERCHMDRKQKVDALIANSASGWAESDRKYLMEVEETVLDKFAKVKQVEVTPTTNAATTPPPNPPAPAPAHALTFNELLAAADPNVQEVIQEGMGALQENRAKLIKTITNSKGNAFTEAELNGMKTPLLRKMAGLIPQEQPAVTANGFYPFTIPGGQTFAGVAGGNPTTNAVTETPLGIPSVFGTPPAAGK